MYEQSMNHISVKKIRRPRCIAKLPTTQDAFHRANTRPHQLRWGDREIATTIAGIECSQVAGLPQKGQ